MEAFNWKVYIENYPDLSAITTESAAFRHYTLYGKAENRIYQPLTNINTTNLNCKFGATVFYNIICNYIAKCNNLKIDYHCFDETKELGIDLYNGTNQFDENLVLTDLNINLILGENISKNIIIHSSLQTPKVANFIKDFLLKLKTKITTVNPFKTRYNSNNDLFVHVRLDGKNNSNDFEPFEYYDSAISKISFDKGYISTDCILHPICTKLIRKYNLEVLNENEVKTIQWASTCKCVVLSKCTFSWLIGVFSFYSNIYYPERLNKFNKHGNLFVFKDWNKVNY